VLSEHAKWMKAALALAKRGLGKVAPNPAVGCLLVKDGVVIGRGWTQQGGRPHAETEALAMAGTSSRGATAYVTLEPCAHHGETPPCAEALIKAQVAKVIIAVQDPDPRVAGRGVSMLQAAGISVEQNILKDQALALNAGFFNRVTKQRPFFTLKSASSIDGRIATSSGDSQWITGPEARRYGHMLRAQHDAIVVGINTVLADNPALDCRLEGLENFSPVPVVLDSNLRIPIASQLLMNAFERPPIIICNESLKNSVKANDIINTGAKLIFVPDVHDVENTSKCLAKLGFNRVLVEGGGQVLASFLGHNFCDQLLVFVGSKVIGGDGLPAVGKLGLAHLADTPHLTLKAIRKIGADLLATYVNAE